MSRARDPSGPLTFPRDQGDAQHLHTIFEHANDAILLIDPETVLLLRLADLQHQQLPPRASQERSCRRAARARLGSIG
jgi:hypothetical protein